MGDRGSVHAFQPQWTEPDPANPGRRRLRTASTWHWRFEWRAKRYTGGDNFHTKREALDAGEKRKAEVRRGLEADPHKTTFAALDLILAAEATLEKPGTAASTHAVLNRLRPFFEHDRLAEIKRERAIEYIAHQRAKGYQDSTIQLDLRLLRKALGLAYEAGLVLAVSKFPHLDVKPRRQTIPPHELEAILAQLPEHWVRYYLIADECGWRARSEIRSRQWTDVEWGPPGWVRLDAEHSKTGEPRAFPITDRLRALLVEQRAWIEALQERTGRVIPWVFAKPDGTKLGDPRKAWASATRRAGFGKLEGRTGPWSSAKVAHDIRRTVLRRWATLGEGLDVRMAAAGHASAETHMGYVGGDADSLQAFAERLNAARANAPAPTVVPLRRP